MTVVGRHWTEALRPMGELGRKGPGAVQIRRSASKVPVSASTDAPQPHEGCRSAAMLSHVLALLDRTTRSRTPSGER